MINKNDNNILVGDFNSHSIMWGSNTTNKQVLTIEEFLDTCNLVCLNDGTPTFLSDINGAFSCLDLMLVSAHMSSDCEWNVMESLSSDHFPIMTEYNVKTSWTDDPNFIPKWNFKRANWNLFKHEYNKIKFEELISINIDTFNKSLVDVIIKIADKAIPKTQAVKPKKLSFLVESRISKLSDQT